MLLTAAVSGLAIFTNKFFVGLYADPYVYTTVKNVLAAALLMALIALTREAGTLRRLARGDWLKLAAIGVVGGSVPFLLFFKGLTLTTAASGAFIHKTMFVYVALLAAVFLGEGLNLRRLTAALILLAGNLLAIGLNAYTLNEGDMLILAATLLWAAETIIAKNALANIKPGVVASARMAFGSAVLLLFLAATGRAGQLAALTAQQLAAAAATSVLLFLYTATWYTGLKRLQASTATVVLMLGSPVTTALSAVFLSAAVPAAETAGILLLLAGVAAYVKVSAAGRQPAAA